MQALVLCLALLPSVEGLGPKCSRETRALFKNNCPTALVKAAKEACSHCFNNGLGAAPGQHWIPSQPCYAGKKGEIVGTGEDTTGRGNWVVEIGSNECWGVTSPTFKNRQHRPGVPIRCGSAKYIWQQGGKDPCYANGYAGPPPPSAAPRRRQSSGAPRRRQSPAPPAPPAPTPPPYVGPVFWTKGAAGDNCMKVCGGEDQCAEGVWPRSKEAFSKILKNISETGCTTIEDGDWTQNPAIYTGHDKECRWASAEEEDRCAASDWSVSRFCPCKTEVKAATTVPPTTTASPTTTAKPPAQRRRSGSRRRRRRKSGRKGSKNADIASPKSRRRRRRRRRRRKQEKQE